MPEISRFYEIVIAMLFKQKEHNPPHVRVTYGGYEASVNIKDLKVTGKLPPKAKDLVTEWIKKHQKELLEMWDNQIFKPIEPLK